MAMNNQALLDMLKPKEEEPMMSEMAPISQNRLTDIPPAQPELQAPMIPNETPQEQVFSIPAKAEQPMLAEAEAQQPSPEVPAAPMSKSEALLAEYQKMLGKDQQSLEDARSRDRMLKVGGSIGDALATYLNAKSQMNVKAPGVQVQQGAGLGKVADMFATAPEIQSDVAQRRQALMDQYKQLAIGESSAAKRELEKQRIQAMEEKNRLYGQQVERMGAGREESRQFREEKFEYDKIKNLQDSFNKDKQVIKAEERMASARTMRDFLTENNPIGAEAAKRFAARASGEVGTLTDQDVSVFGGSRAVLDRLQQAAQELATGTLTENNKKFMNQLADTFEKAGQRDLQDRLTVYAKQGTKRTKMSEDEVKETIRPDLVLQKQEQIKPSIAPKDQQALDWANKNPTDPRSIQIKKRLGM
jgi:hypothetical protein